jgi:hypothetical protein
MNTPNETPENTTPNADSLGDDRRPGKGRGRDRTQRAAFWLRTIELQQHRKMREYRKSLRAVAREGISDEEYAAMLGTLEKMARNLGWDETQPDGPFGRGQGRGFGPGFGHGHRHPAMMHGKGGMRGFRRMHPADHRDIHAEDVTTDTPRA